MTICRNTLLMHTRTFAALFLFMLITATAYAFPPAPVPQTGQTTCYAANGSEITCDGTGQDGESQTGLQWPIPRFVDNGVQSVTDKLTGLIWAKDANLMKTRDPLFDQDKAMGYNSDNDGRVTWQHALDYVKKLNQENYLGYNDWRLPNCNELESMGQGNRTTWLHEQGFTNVQDGDGHWSSTTNPGEPRFAMGVGMFAGYGGNHNYKAYVGNVWPVRTGPSVPSASLTLPKTGQTTCYSEDGSTISCVLTGQDGEIQAGVAWPNPRFADNGDQSVTDKLTGLIWAKDANPAASTKTWQEALDYIKALNNSNYLGHNDWHIPNLNEIESLLNKGQSDQVGWLNSVGFTNVRGDFYWDSTTSTAQLDSLWTVYMKYGGYEENVAKTNKFYAWPVRSGQFWAFNPFVISVAPKFGTIPVGAFAISREIVLGNRGSNDQPATSITISGVNASEFFMSTGGSNPCSSLSPTLAAGASCTLLVNSSPASLGIKSAFLSITANSTIEHIPLSGTAISTIYGLVTDQSTGLGLSGATITLNSSVSTTTGTNGSYTFGNLPAATYSINVSKTDYQATTKSGLVTTSTSSAKADILLPTTGPLNITTPMLPSATAVKPI